VTRELRDVMESKISHLSVTSSNAKSREEPLPSGRFSESFQALSAVTNGTQVTNTHCFTAGLGNSLFEVMPGLGKHELEGQNKWPFSTYSMSSRENGFCQHYTVHKSKFPLHAL
jgi:hypothetical protein